MRPNLCALGVIALLLSTLSYREPAWAEGPPTPGAPGAPPDRPPITLPHPESYTLPNGMRVVMDEDHRAPFVGIAIALPTGPLNDPAGRAGMSNLTGRLLRYAETRHISRNDRDALFRSLDLSPFYPEVETEPELTMLKLTVPSRALPLAMWLESDRLGFFADGIQEDITGDVLAEMDRDASRTSAQPYGAVVERSIEAAFGVAHPYGQLFKPASETLSSVTPAELRAHIGRHYGPDQVVLSLSGDFQPTPTKEIVARYFGSLAGAPRHADAAAAEGQVDGERRLTMEADVEWPMIVLIWRTPRYLDDRDLILDLAGEILFTRLDRLLVRELRVAEGISCWERSFHQGSAFIVQVRMRKDASADEIIRRVDGEITRLGAEVSPGELETAKNLMKLGGLRHQLSPVDRAGSIASLMLAGGDTSTLERQITFRQSVDGDRLRAVVRAELPLLRRVITTVKPNPASPKAGRVVGGG
ncbi:MAG: insulinase family protein [Byssovorax sp.]